MGRNFSIGYQRLNPAKFRRDDIYLTLKDEGEELGVYIQSRENFKIKKNESMSSNIIEDTSAYLTVGCTRDTDFPVLEHLLNNLGELNGPLYENRDRLREGAQAFSALEKIKDTSSKLLD